MNWLVHVPLETPRLCFFDNLLLGCSFAIIITTSLCSFQSMRFYASSLSFN